MDPSKQTPIEYQLQITKKETTVKDPEVFIISNEGIPDRNERSIARTRNLFEEQPQRYKMEQIKHIANRNYRKLARVMRLDK